MITASKIKAVAERIERLSRFLTEDESSDTIAVEDREELHNRQQLYIDQSPKESSVLMARKARIEIIGKRITEFVVANC